MAFILRSPESGPSNEDKEQPAPTDLVADTEPAKPGDEKLVRAKKLLKAEDSENVLHTEEVKPSDKETGIAGGTEVGKKQKEDDIIGKPLKERGIKMHLRAKKGEKEPESFGEVMEAALPDAEKPEKKKGREYDKLGNQLLEFEILRKEGKEKEVIRLAGKMAGGKIEDIEEAKEIYKKKLGLYKIATKLLVGNKRTGQIADIIKQIKKEGKFKFGDKEFDTDETKKLKKEGKKINGRVILGKNGEYYFEIAGVKFSLAGTKKLEPSRGRQPKAVDVLPVNVEPPQESSSSPKIKQSQISEPEPAEPLDKGPRVKFKYKAGHEPEVLQNNKPIVEESPQPETSAMPPAEDSYGGFTLTRLGGNENEDDEISEEPKPEMPIVPVKPASEPETAEAQEKKKRSWLDIILDRNK